jgi:hypothetical protein
MSQQVERFNRIVRRKLEGHTPGEEKLLAAKLLIEDERAKLAAEKKLRQEELDRRLAEKRAEEERRKKEQEEAERLRLEKVKAEEERVRKEEAASRAAASAGAQGSEEEGGDSPSGERDAEGNSNEEEGGPRRTSLCRKQCILSVRHGALLVFNCIEHTWAPFACCQNSS